MFNKTLIFILCLFLSSCLNKAPLSIPEFSIQTEKGLFNSRQNIGAKLFIYFGFTHCPHVCPKTLSNLHRFHKNLSKDEKKNLKVLFISVDSERDSISVLERKFNHLPYNFYGAVTGEKNLAKIMSIFGANYKVIKYKDSNEIAIDHSTSIYVINSKGEWVDSLNYDSSPEKLKQAFKAADTMGPIAIRDPHSKQYLILGENKECNLAKTSCSLLGYEIKILPFSIKALKTYKIVVNASKTNKKPEEIIIECLDSHTVVINSKLTKDSTEEFIGEFNLPVIMAKEVSCKVQLQIGKDESAKRIIFDFLLVAPH